MSVSLCITFVCLFHMFKTISKQKAMSLRSFSSLSPAGLFGLSSMSRTLRVRSSSRLNVTKTARTFSDRGGIIPRQLSGPQRSMIETLEEAERDPRYVFTLLP